MVRQFRWVSASRIPAAYDLRQGGWRLIQGSVDDNCPCLAPIRAVDAAIWIVLLGIRGRAIRQRMILLGVEDLEERARLLQLGFGDVLGSSTSLAELEERAVRITREVELLPRFRKVGPLKLDLFQREAMVDRRALGLHPREFELLWRLSDTPGVPVSKSRLLAEVWNMGFVPDTNSLAVHVYRLRTKLALAGLEGLVQTAPSGGYMVVPDAGRSIFSEQVMSGISDRAASLSGP